MNRDHFVAADDMIEGGSLDKIAVLKPPCTGKILLPNATIRSIMGVKEKK